MALIDNIVSYYKLDETSGVDVVDSNEGANNGTLNGATINQPGKINTSYSFDGTASDFIDGLGNDTFLSAAGSISGWFKCGDAVTDNNLLGFGTIAVGLGNIQGSGAADGVLTGGLHDGVSWKFTYSTSTTLNNDAWHHFVYTWNGTITRLYIDGSEDDNLNGGSPNTINRAQILGAEWNSLINWSGELDEIGIWSRALTDPEVTALYNSGDGFAYPFTAAGLNLQINIGDTWKGVAAAKINIGDDWKEVAAIKLNMGDNWKIV